MLGEERFIRGIHGGEIVQIFHENGGFHDIAHFQASGFNDSFYVVQGLTRLRGDIFRHAAGFRVYWDLAGSDDHATQINALYIWADSSWCLFRRNSFAHNISR